MKLPLNYREIRVTSRVGGASAHRGRFTQAETN
jgi:hypothetical protein